VTPHRCMNAHSRRVAIVAAILRYKAEHNGVSPTVREIGRAVGLASPSSVQAHLITLERAGLISTGALGQPRTIQVRLEAS
jgi:repressor LexA